MKKIIRSATCLALAAATVLAPLGTSQAQGKPRVHVLVGYPAGAGTDTIARIYAEALRTSGKFSSVVVENKVGAGGLLAAQALKNATDSMGSTVMVTMDHQVIMLPIITKNPGFDVRKDFVPIARVVRMNVCFAVPGSSPQASMQDYLKAAKDTPELANYGVPAAGSQADFVGYVVGRHFGVKLTAVPYRGAAPAVSDLIGAQVAAAVVPCDALLEHHKAGRVRILAVAAETRWPGVNAPTFKELGVEMPTENFVAIYAASSVKPDVLRALDEATRDMFKDSAFVEKINATNLPANYGSGADLAKLVEESTVFWGDVVKQTGFQLQ